MDDLNITMVNGEKLRVGDTVTFDLRPRVHWFRRGLIRLRLAKPLPERVLAKYTITASASSGDL